jgi:chitinase
MRIRPRIDQCRALLILALFGLAGAPAARAQTQPALVIDDVIVPFETNGGAGLATFTVRFPDSTAHGSVTVSFSTTGGTATSGTSCNGAGVDFAGVNSLTLSFSPTDRQKQIAITVCGDTRDEPDETFFVNLFGASGAVIQDAQGQATLIDDDPPPTLRVNDVAITEGAAGAVANAVFTVILTGSTQNTVAASYTTGNRSATAGSCGTPNVDYATTSAALTFAASQPSQTLTIPVCGDRVREGTEQFEVRLSGATNATIQDGTGVGTITDDEPLPTLSILADVQSAEPEGKLGSPPVFATFRVTLAGPPTAQTVQVRFATAPGTATPGPCLVSVGLRPGDYATQTGTLSFAPGVTTQEIRVAICADRAIDPNETFTVTLSNPVNATIAQGVGVGTIR